MAKKTKIEIVPRVKRFWSIFGSAPAGSGAREDKIKGGRATADEKKMDEARLFLEAQTARANEIRQATGAYPEMEIGAAYKKWKETKGEMSTRLNTRGSHNVKEGGIQLAKELSKRPCTKEGCAGVQHLEAVCTGCIEGQAGYKTKWTCDVCMHRELSKEDFTTWIRNLSLLRKL